MQILNKESEDCQLGRTDFRNPENTSCGRPAEHTFSSGRIQLFLALLRLMRPGTLILPSLGIISGAAVASAFESGQTDQQAPALELFLSNWRMVLAGILMASILNAASNVLNQLAEIELDRINKPSRVLVLGQVSIRTAIMVCGILFSVSLLIAWYITPEPGYRGAFCFALFASVLTAAYSIRPFYLKARIWLSNASIAISRGLLLTLAGWSCISATLAVPDPWLIGGIFFLFFFGAASTKDFADVKGDRKHNCQTLVVRYGPATTVRILIPFLVAPWLLLASAAGLQLIKSVSFPLNGSVILMVIVSTCLASYGIAVAVMMRNAITRDQTDLKNSWPHMYALACTAQIAVATIYLSQ